MNKFWQIFVAPGDENEPLPISPSPWFLDRYVRIPRGHWDLIIDYAKTINSECAERLNSHSFATEDNDDYDYVHFDAQELENLINFITDLSEHIQKSDSIHPKATEELPDEYENSEYARMLMAVGAVFREALNQGAYFRAWIE